MQTQPVPRGSAPCGRADPPPVGARDGAFPGSVASHSDTLNPDLRAALIKRDMPISMQFRESANGGCWVISTGESRWYESTAAGARRLYSAVVAQFLSGARVAA